MSIRFIRSCSFIRPLNNSIFLNKIFCNNCSTNVFTTLPSSGLSENENKLKKKKTAIIPKITLIQGPDLTVTTLEEAQKLSKRRDLKLVKIIDLDTKTQRPVYKLMTGTEYHAEDIKQRALKKETRQNSIKGEKVLMISHGIYEHDLQTHINKIKKLINKMYEVRVVINGNLSNMEKAESVYKFIETSMDKDVKILQKRQKGSDIRFQIVPPKKSNEAENL